MIQSLVLTAVGCVVWLVYPAGAGPLFLLAFVFAVTSAHHALRGDEAAPDGVELSPEPRPGEATGLETETSSA